MAKIYADLIIEGVKSITDVPSSIKDSVISILSQMGVSIDEVH